MTGGSPSVRAVGFDFDHTLGLDHQLERVVALELMQNAARASGVAFDAISAGAAVTEAIASFRAGAVPLDDALAGLGVEPQVFRRLAVERAPQYVTAVPGARNVLAWLRERNIPTAILTNGWSPLQEAKARAIDFTGPILVSESLGVRKPARAAFDALANTLKVAPKDILFVGDDPAVDIVGALEAGMRAAWLDWENRSYPKRAPAPTWRIATLPELDGLLGQVEPAANPAT